MNAERLYEILEKHVPANALSYCFSLWLKHPFEFKLRKKRITKVGDFTHRRDQAPSITINHDSHPYLFVITYVHEVAHLVVHQEFGWKQEAHGQVWKDTFRKLMEPILNEHVFPKEVLVVLQEHMINPKASSFSDSRLSQVLRKQDERLKSVVLLSEIPEGSTFGFHGRWFRKGPHRRTRVLCHELKTRKNFLVPLDAPVESAQLTFL